MINKLQRDGMCARRWIRCVRSIIIHSSEHSIISEILHYSIKFKVVAIGTGSKHKEKYDTSDIRLIRVIDSHQLCLHNI